MALVAAVLGTETPPAAPLARRAAGLDWRDAGWFCAEPVTLVPDRDRLVLLRLDQDGLSEAEARALIESVHAHFPSRELRLELSSGGRWYARAPELDLANGVPPVRAEGERVNEALTPGLAGSTYARLLNEVQMLWHDHPVNLTRRQEGRAPVNTLWLWGGGPLPGTAPALERSGYLIGSSAELEGLAAWTGLRHERLAPPPARASHAGVLVVIGEGEEAIGESWLEALAARREAFRVLATAGEWFIARRLLSGW